MSVVKIERIDSQLRKAFSSVKNEFEEHLDGINRNTEEIQALFGHLQDVEEKIDKLTERLDEMQFSLRPKASFPIEDLALSTREQEVFTVIYLASEPLALDDIAKKLGLTVAMVHNHVYRLMSKGIPLIHEFIDDKFSIKLDSQFKDLQMRKNILKIEESVSRGLLAKKLI